jgi:hypothetical protein
MELKGIEFFKKGSVVRKINEDPTLLSFVLLFNTGSVEDSPLLTDQPGGALDYLENVVAGDYGAGRASKLRNFQKLLLKINREMPWFWDKLTGLEATMQFNKMEDPFWGYDKKIDIECLDENVELMAVTLMRLYRDACYDFERWVEVIPYNLRRFSVDIFVTEVRNFQQNYSSRDRDLFGNLPKGYVNPTDDAEIAPELTPEAKPIIHVSLRDCSFDLDSTNEMIGELTKNPETKKPKISFFWRTVRTPSYRPGANLGIVTEEDTLIPPKDPTVDAYNPASPILGAAKSKLAKLKDKAIGGTVAQAKNLAQGVLGGPGIGNAYGKVLGGAAGQIANNLGEAALGKLLLDNVYGLGVSSTISNALTAGSINGILNAAGQALSGLAGGGDDNTGPISPKQVYDITSTLDSTPDGNISPKKVYDPSAPDRDDPINDNVYE